MYRTQKRSPHIDQTDNKEESRYKKRLVDKTPDTKRHNLTMDTRKHTSRRAGVPPRV